jgi:hypothetical protein
MRQWWHSHHEAKANDPNSPNVHRREVSLSTVQLEPVFFTFYRCASAELFFSCCSSVKLQWARVQKRMSRPHSLTPSALFTAQTAREAGMTKPLHFPVRDSRARMRHRHFLFPVSNFHTEFLTFLRTSLPLFLLRTLRLQAFSSREIFHMQAGQCDNQMGAEFWEVVRDEHGIGRNGKHFGDNNAQLGRIIIFFYKASGGKYVLRAVLFDLSALCARRLSASSSNRTNS